MAHGQVLLSPHAHARIKEIDVTHARATPGVVGLLTGSRLTYRPRPLSNPVVPFHGPDHCLPMMPPGTLPVGPAGDRGQVGWLGGEWDAP
jgi:CO/xanthine dehydrogenase Mo-binding subunit